MNIYSIPGLALMCLCIQLSICSTAQADSTFENPPLSMQPYDKLHMPPQLPKAEVEWILGRAVEELDQKAFVDLGDMSDFMHMHVVFGHEPGMKLDKGLEDLSWTPPWEDLDPILALFHAQEYESARQRRPYLNRAGKEVSAYHRNQILWLNDTKWTKRGELTSARHFADPKRAEAYTISSSDLDERVVGKNARDFEFSFYFFRAHCPDVDAQVKAGVNLAESNVIELKVGGERACLALVSFHCRNHPKDKQFCPEANLRPFYTPAGPAKYK